MFSVILWVYCDDKDTSLLGASLINVYHDLEIPNLLIRVIFQLLGFKTQHIILIHYVISQDKAETSFWFS